jgi:hypothetical protein
MLFEIIYNFSVYLTATGRKLGPGSRDSSDVSGDSIEGYQQSSRLERWKF